MAQLDHRVAPLSKGPRALVCWQGRQVMRAVMGLVVLSGVGFAEESELVTCGGWVWVLVGDRLMVRSSHQSSSVTVELSIPDAVNQALLPRGTKKCAFGCFVRIFMMVGWSMWS